METQFCLATVTDVDLLIEFMRQFYAIDHYPFEEHAAHHALVQMLQDHSLGRIWLIVSDFEVIGYVVLTFGYSLEYHGRDAFIDELFIAQGHRNQGIGTRAMKFVIERCPELGVHALHLEVERTNVVGQALYHKVGFQDHERYLMTRLIEN